MLEFAAPTVLPRMGPLGLVAAVAGGYAYKKYANHQDAEKVRAQRPIAFAFRDTIPAPKVKIRLTVAR